MTNRLTYRKLPHPATMYFLCILLVAFLSWICDVYGLRAVQPDTGQVIHVKSLLSPEGVRWWLRHVVANFMNFTPLGMVIVAVLGIGVAQQAGLMDACIRSLPHRIFTRNRVICGVALLGLLSDVAGDAGYVVLLPLAAFLFQAAGMSPVAGIVVAYVSVACGFSANVLLTPLDSQLALLTQEAMDGAMQTPGYLGPLCNYCFFAASTFLLLGIIYWVTRYCLLPKLGESLSGETCIDYKRLSRKEHRALVIACIVGGCYVLLVAFSTFSSWGILRSADGGLARSPFMFGFLFLFSLGIGLMGLVYGWASGRYRSDTDVVDGLVHSMRLLSVYLVIAFFASQMFACFEYSGLDRCIAIITAESIAAIQIDRLWLLVIFIVFTALINLVMVSATSKWAFMSFIFVPVFAGLGISPEVTQCAFRIGDSATNAVAPFMYYLPLVLVYMQRYDARLSYVSLLCYTWPYSVLVFVGWIALFVLWYIIGLPWGI